MKKNVAVVMHHTAICLIETTNTTATAKKDAPDRSYSDPAGNVRKEK